MTFRCIVSREKAMAHEVSELKVIFTSFSTVEYSQIDWHDFVIVETISFRESEAGTFFTHTWGSSPSTFLLLGPKGFC